MAFFLQKHEKQISNDFLMWIFHKLFYNLDFRIYIFFTSYIKWSHKRWVWGTGDFKEHHLPIGKNKKWTNQIITYNEKQGKNNV